jgi:hypothetical protein
VPTHSTDYADAFIEVADDCACGRGTVPPEKTTRTVARMQYDLIRGHPYRYTSDELLFAVFAERQGIPPEEAEERRREFFSKGQPCLRSSPLGKAYGWGIHFNAESKIALFARESHEYAAFRADRSLRHLKAMKNAR